MWMSQDSLTANHLNDIHMFNSSIGWIVGNSGTILKTINGGTSWDSQYSATNANLRDIQMMNSDTGWVVGYDGTILRTTDGGEWWFSSHTISGDASPGDLISIHMLDYNAGWSAGLSDNNQDDIILKTTNGGTSWDVTIFPADFMPYYISDLYMINYQTGWVIGDNNLLHKTEDGGDSWLSQSQNIGPPPGGFPDRI
jgi:photosystem II stability/assembly factor-like uncharacterized protein